MEQRGDSNFIKKSIARQLRKPSGWPVGWIVLNLLNRWNRAMNRKTLAAMEIKGGERVLELGCGGGELLGLIAQESSSARIIGIDWSPLAVRYCRRKLKLLIGQGRLELFCHDAAQMPVPDNVVDCICSVNTVYFWGRLEDVFSECARALKSSGRIVLCNAVLSDLDRDDYPPEFFRDHTEEKVGHVLSSLGFSVPVVSYDQDQHARYYVLRATMDI